MSIALIAAVARNAVIGRDNQLLWRLKADLRHFRTLTIGKPVIMGRKTHLSIGMALPNRDNVVLTRDKAFKAEGVFIVHSLQEAFAKAAELAKARAVKEIMVAGGAEIYAQSIAQADRLHITEVDLEPDGDAVFPAIDRKLWREVSRMAHPRSPDNEAAYAFVDYVRQ